LALKLALDYGQGLAEQADERLSTLFSRPTRAMQRKPRLPAPFFVPSNGSRATAIDGPAGHDPQPGSDLIARHRHRQGLAYQCRDAAARCRTLPHFDLCLHLRQHGAALRAVEQALCSSAGENASSTSRVPLANHGRSAEIESGEVKWTRNWRKASNMRRRLLNVAIGVVGAAPEHVELTENWARDPKIVGLTILCRSISNFRAALLLV
jgi:hypothetical protein